MCIYVVEQALVDLPDIVRRPVSFKRLAITDFKVDIKRCPRKQDLKQALDNARMLSLSILFFGRQTRHTWACSWLSLLLSVHECTGVYERWAQSSWGKKIAAQQKKKALTDFERYKLKVARSKVRCFTCTLHGYCI